MFDKGVFDEWAAKSASVRASEAAERRFKLLYLNVPAPAERCPCGGLLLPWRGHNTPQGEVKRCTRCGAKK